MGNFLGVLFGFPCVWLSVFLETKAEIKEYPIHFVLLKVID